VVSSSHPSLTRRPWVGLEQRLLGRVGDAALPPGSLVVIGFSGGPHSLALAACLQRVADKAQHRLLALHIDHALRDSSRQEMARAADLARSLDIPFRTHRLSGDLRRSHPGVGLEEAARRERYWTFAEIAETTGAAVVAVGHHQADQAETVLLHLGRGAGLRGLSGMADDRVLSVPWWVDDRPIREVRIWRPLLAETPTTLQRYLEQRGLVPVIDPSNDDLTVTRNQVRAQIVPAMDAVFPDWAGSFERLARIVRDDDAALDQWSAEAANEVARDSGELSMASLTRYPVAIQRRLVRRWLATSGVRPLPPFERVEAILHLASGATAGRTIEIGEGWSVETRHGLLSVRHDRTATGHTPAPETDPV